MTYSIDFRKKVLAIKEKEKLTYDEAAKRFQIGKTTLVRWNKKLDPQTTRNKPATKSDMKALKRNIELYPDAYTYESAKRLGVSQVGDLRALRRLGVTYKKNLKPSDGGFRKTIYVLPKN